MTPKPMMAALVALTLAGCGAHTTSSYRHLSDPRIANDGYDLICQGLEVREDRLEASVDICGNIAPAGGEFLLTEITYHWKD